MSNLSAFYGPNAGYVLELYDRYLEDPNAVDPEMRAFFAEFDPALPSTNGASTEAIPAAAQPGPATIGAAEMARIVGAADLASGIREYGHLATRLDPLGSAPPGAPEIEAATYGITDADLARLPASVVGGPAVDGAETAADAIARLREIYSGSIGFDFDHIQVADERAWLRDSVESRRFATPLSPEAKRALLERLTEVETFERFLHQTYLGQ